MATLIDDSGQTRFEGTIDGALPAGGTTGQVLTKASNADDDADWETGGGGATARQSIVGCPNVTIADGGNDRLVWNGTSFGPDVLLDRSTTDLPFVLTAGIYGVVVEINSEALTVGGSYQVSLDLDRDGVDAVMTMDSAPATAGVPAPILSVAFSWYIPANGTIGVTVRNHDGAAARTFSIEVAQIQKIS